MPDPSAPTSLSISLTLNGRAVSIEVSPTDRLLDTLRYQLNLSGAKEGCGEGECGACTVHVGGIPVNSCLVPTYQVHGRDLRTIESTPPTSLAPLLATGATQCGACTPGVVMTARWIKDQAANNNGRPNPVDTFTVRELMAGNLCRCTGYDGIIEGVEASLTETSSLPAPEGPTLSHPVCDTAPEGRTMPRTHSACNGARLLIPTSLPDALSYLSRDSTILPIAGATDLLVHWPTNLPAHDRVYLDLSRLEPELRPIRWSDTHLTLGALTTYWDTINDAQAVAEFPLLLAAARVVGAIQIQSRGTWAGNIANASPAADGVPVLMAYDAVVVLTSTTGQREVPLCDFYTGYRATVRRPDELITAIQLPRRPYDLNIFEKVGPRRAQAITKVGVAITRSPSWVPSAPTGPRHVATGEASPPRTSATRGPVVAGSSRPGGAEETPELPQTFPSTPWRIVANSVAPTVRRCPSIEKLLDSGPPLRSPADLIPAIRRDVSPIDDLRSTAHYREQVLARLIYHAVADQLAGPRSPVADHPPSRT